MDTIEKRMKDYVGINRSQERDFNINKNINRNGNDNMNNTINSNIINSSNVRWKERKVD